MGDPPLTPVAALLIICTIVARGESDEGMVHE